MSEYESENEELSDNEQAVRSKSESLKKAIRKYKSGDHSGMAIIRQAMGVNSNLDAMPLRIEILIERNVITTRVKIGKHTPIYDNCHKYLRDKSIEIPKGATYLYLDVDKELISDFMKVKEMNGSWLTVEEKARYRLYMYDKHGVKIVSDKILMAEPSPEMLLVFYCTENDVRLSPLVHVKETMKANKKKRNRNKKYFTYLLMNTLSSINS